MAGVPRGAPTRSEAGPTKRHGSRTGLRKVNPVVVLPLPSFWLVAWQAMECQSQDRFLRMERTSSAMRTKRITASIYRLGVCQEQPSQEFKRKFITFDEDHIGIGAQRPHCDLRAPIRVCRADHINRDVLHCLMIPSHLSLQKVPHAPDVIGDPRCHSWRNTQ